jgi:hypothetical protein
MHIQFRTLTFNNRPEEQVQERLCLKKFVTSLTAAIEALDPKSPLMSPRGVEYVILKFNKNRNGIKTVKTDTLILSERFTQNIFNILSDIL